MLIPAVVDFFLNSSDWPAFLASSFVTLFFGAGFYLSSRGNKSEHLELRQAFLLTNFAWISISNLWIITLFVFRIKYEFSRCSF